MERIDSVDDALQFLVETDEEYGRLKGKSRAAEYLLKARKGQLFLDAEGKTDAAKKAYVDMAAVEMGYVQEYKDSVADFETLSAQRATVELKIEVWRSRASAKKQGINI